MFKFKNLGERGIQGETDLCHFAEVEQAVHWGCQAFLITLGQRGMKFEQGILLTEYCFVKFEEFIAAESAISLPLIPTWLSTHNNCIFIWYTSNSKELIFISLREMSRLNCVTLRKNSIRNDEFDEEFDEDPHKSCTT